MNNNYCLELLVDEQEKELVFGVLYMYDVLGVEENAFAEKSGLKCYFGSMEIAELVQEHLQKNTSAKNIHIGVVADQDWNAKWRESMEPAQLTDTLWVSPPWLPPHMNENGHWIKIEPKMAFGTGHHETTRLAANALMAVSPKAGTAACLLDIGTGSGILCFAGDYAGYASCVGIEIDTDCLENLVENREGNTCRGHVSFMLGPLDCIAAGTKYDVIVMNMIRTESEPLLGRCKDLLCNNGMLVWSGILCDEKDSVVEHAVNNGWQLMRENLENEWWCGVFEKMFDS
jgi:ribosomal protein L11 methyltransferase